MGLTRFLMVVEQDESATLSYIIVSWLERDFYANVLRSIPSRHQVNFDASPLVVSQLVVRLCCYKAHFKP